MECTNCGHEAISYRRLANGNICSLCATDKKVVHEIWHDGNVIIFSDKDDCIVELECMRSQDPEEEYAYKVASMSVYDFFNLKEFQGF